MTERYAFRYTEYLGQKRHENCVFDAKTDADPLKADILSRFWGKELTAGFSPLAPLGILVQSPMTKAFQELIDDASDYGADALRVAYLENKMPLSHNQKAAAWRLVDKVWQMMKDSDLPDVYSWNNPVFYPVLSALQKQDVKGAWLNLKTILHNDALPAGIAYGLYPFMPFLVQSIFADIHSKMPLFWDFVLRQKLPPCYFVEVNGAFVLDFYPKNAQDFEQIQKEALSFAPVQNKIKNRMIKRVVNITGKGLNFVV